MKQYKIIYWSTLAGIIILAGILEFIPVLDGLGTKGSMTEFYLQYALIIITLVAIYAALKMIKKNPILRMSILEIPAIASLICYHVFMNASFGYLAIICALAYAFVYPARISEDEDKKNDENSLTSNP